MKRFATMLLVAGLGATSLPAVAMEMGQAARFGAAVGRYSSELKVEGFDSGGNLVAGGDVTNVKLTYGGELGYTITLSDFYADIGLNMLKVRLQNVDNWRTDALFTVGYYLNDNWSLFAGFRRGWQGDGVFKQDKFREIGPYLGFGFASARWQILVLFLVYALYHGLAEGAERAIIADLAERGARGRAFGMYHGLVGVAALPAGLGTGLLWDRFGARWALGINAGCAALAALFLFWLAFGGPLRRGAVSSA